MTREAFGHNISKLVFSRNKRHLKILTGNLVTNKMKIYLHWIGSEVSYTNIVTTKCRSSGPSSNNSDWIQDSSVAVPSSACLYSDLLEEWAIVICFREDQEIWLWPRKIANLLVDRRSSTHPAQSASQKVYRCEGERFESVLKIV
jgi:hypothetical protein